MTDQEEISLAKSMALARAALHAATERERVARRMRSSDDAEDEQGSLHHFRFARET